MVLKEKRGQGCYKALRNAGRVPCVLYGGGESYHFSAQELDFNKLVYTPNAHTVEIILDEKQKSMQFFKIYNFIHSQIKYCTLIFINSLRTKKFP